MGTGLALGSRPVGGREIGARAWAAARTEAGLAGIATGLLALHVVDDNFLQPQPGTSAADHLVSGLVPLVLLAGFLFLSKRLRGGARGVVAIAFGLFGIAAGVGEAGYYSLETGPSGDDYTGLLAIPAGLLLAGVGAATLWRTRRRGDRLAWRYLRRLLLTAAAVVGAYVVLAPLALTYILTHSARAVVPQAELGAAYEKVAFKTGDGLTLRGWYVPSRNGAAVISAPGRAHSQVPARMLVRHGYGVLLFDRRGEGESDGDPNIFGWGAEGDLNAAVVFLQGRADVDRNRIGGIGLSVGGETMLHAAAEADGLKAVVSDGAGFRSIREELARPGTAKWGEVPSSLVMTVGTALFSNHAPPPEIGSLVPRIAPRPVLFIYGEHDQANVKDLTPRFYAKASQPKALWRVPGAAHTGGIDTHPREYERRVIAFFDHALLKKL
jgi:MYXO-CTERM domain-containing protein